LFLAIACTTASAALSILKTLPLGEDARYVAVDPVLRKAFITNHGPGTVSVIDYDGLTVAATITVAPGPDGIIGNAATHRIYVLHDTTPGKVTVIDARTYAVVTTITVGDEPLFVAADFQRGELYVVNFKGKSLSVVDVGSNAVVGTIALGSGPDQVGVNTVLGKLYVPIRGNKTVLAIDQKTRAVVKTIPVGADPTGAAIDESNGRVFVANVDDSSLSVIGSLTDIVVKTITGVTTGDSSNYVVYPIVSPVYHRLYAVDPVLKGMSIVDSDSNLRTAYFTLGGTLFIPTFIPANGEVYVPDYKGGTINVIDARTEKFSSSLNVGGKPWQVIDGGNRLLVLNSNTNPPDTLTIIETQPLLAGTAIATEFYHKVFDHYFHSANAAEVKVLEDGVFADAWNRTLYFWRVWTEPGPGRFPVCRLFSTGFDPKSSHFYTPYAAECAALRAGTVWQYEETSYYIALPDAAGNCPPPLEELYRLYNAGMGGAPNHRITPSRVQRDAMIAAGWTPEGSGPQNVFACTPPLKG